MALKPKTLQEAISIMGELDIAHQFCRRDGKGQSSQTQSGPKDGGSKGDKKGKMKFSGDGSGASKVGPSAEGSSGNKGNKSHGASQSKGT